MKPDRMLKSGQITLEVAVILMLLLLLFSSVTLPISKMSRSASEAIGSAAIAQNVVDMISREARMVALSGNNAEAKMRIPLLKDISILGNPSFSCQDRNVSLSYTTYTFTRISDNPSILSVSLLLQRGDFYATRDSRVELFCNFDVDDECLCFKNDLGTVKINGCNC